MTKFDVDGLDPNDSHSVNISVYKPDGILSFWNWFTRRNKSDGQRKNIKFKINKEDLDRMKLSGFDFQKLQNLNLNDKNKSTRQSNVFAIPKTDLDPFLLKSFHPAMNTKTYVKRLISKSTISIRSKESCANLTYVRTVRSQKSGVNSAESSKTSVKVSMRSNTNVNSNSNQQPRNVFLKSVPTTILKSNTKKLLVLGKGKSPKANRKARTDATENLNSQQNPKQNSNVIPMLLTRMKSMEEHLSDIENTTKKISEAVSQKNVRPIVKTNSRNNFLSTERNRQKAVKCVASHKIYSKNIQNAPRKNKKNRSKKLKNKSNTNNDETPKEAPSMLRPKPQTNKGFSFNYFSDSYNDIHKINHLHHSYINNNKPGLFLNQHGFTFPNNMSKVNLPPENTSSVDCDLFMSVVKALTETKGCTNLNQMDSSIGQNMLQQPKINDEVGIINLGRSNCMSKTTFDWKHTSVPASSEPHISETGKSNQENFKVKKNISVIFGEQDASNVLCDKNYILNQIFNPSMQKQLVLDLLRNNNSKLLPEQGETKPDEDTQTSHMRHPIETVGLSNLDLGVKFENKQRNENVNHIKSLETGVQNISSTHACFYKPTRSHFNEVTGSHREANKLSLEQEQSRLVRDDKGPEENDTLTNVIKCSDIVTCAEKRTLNMQSYEDDGIETTSDRGALCSVSIKQNSVSAAFKNPPEKQFKRTTICCPNAKREPKVSITILVQDSMKGEVEMKSDVLKNTTASRARDERFELPLKEEHSPPLSGFGPRGDQLSTVHSDTYKTESVCSSERLSSVSHSISDSKVKIPLPQITLENSYYSRTNKNFYVEVEDEGRHAFAEEDLNLGSPGTYLNSEKRKVIEEKVLAPKQKRAMVQPVCENEPIPPTRSCSNISNGLTTFDHLIETSFIRQETSYSKTKFNICKENKYSSRTLLQPMDGRKTCPFSDESLSPENNFDISTKYTSQQCVMYCRNKNVQNFKRPKFPLFPEQTIENSGFETRRQPFIVVHTPNNSINNSVVDPTYSNNEKVRQHGISLNTREEPILEVSEDESTVENINIKKQGMDCKNNIEIKTSHNSLIISNYHQQELDKDINGDRDENKLDDIDKPNRNDQEVQHGDIQPQNEDRAATEGNLRCKTTSIKFESGLSDSEFKDNGSTTIESRSRRAATTLTSRVSQTELSSTLVQTDWSLVGITADHLNCSNNKTGTEYFQKRTVASQTDVMMDQITLLNKGLEDLHNCCKSCMKSCQFSELVACNVTVSQAKNLQEDPRSSLENRQVVPFNDKLGLNEIDSGMLVAETGDIDSNGLQCNSSNLPINEGISGSNLLERAQTPKSTSSVQNSYGFTHDFQYCEKKSEESMQTERDYLSHRCSIPCFTTASDDTVMSVPSETSDVSRYFLTVPQSQVINRGICSYLNSAYEKREPNLMSTVEEESRLDNSNSNFCKVIRDNHVEEDEAPPDENCKGFQAYLEAPEAVKDSVIERVVACPDLPDRLVDNNKPLVVERKLKPVLKSKKLNQNSKIVKERKFGNKNYTPKKVRERECSSLEKKTDHMINHLSIDRCNDEKKGNSVFSKT